jgi:hypothetical protein
MEEGVMLNTAINLLVLLSNLVVLGLTIKLYTEILKDRKMDHRSEKP